jgi:hypothetical protein
MSARDLCIIIATIKLELATSPVIAGFGVSDND